MRKHDLNRAMVEATVSRALQDMERDSHRSARNLVDMGLLFARGPFEQRFLTLCRSILEDEASPYYQVINRALAQFDRQSLLTLGMNLGFEGCSRGARRIREIEATQGFNVPWALEIAAGSQGLSRVYIQRTVSEAMELGIHVFLLEDRGIDQGELELLLADNPTCVFGVFTTGSRGPEWDLAGLSRFHNLLMSVQGEEPLALALCRALEERRMPYAVHLAYTDETAGRLPQRLQEAAELRSLLVLLYNQGSSVRVQEAVQQGVQTARTEHAYPFGLVNLPGDILAIDEIISSDPCRLSFLPDGTAVTTHGPTSSNIRHTPLAQILQKELPRSPSQPSDP
ncbi:MAG: hypothetical protein SOY32_09085 [Candidatus Faecousia sp.]|nr:hypothetical protein [Bacillota bacterium]MDY4220558.1 hypothetical protein [Candidatus Faecousia sp.]